MKRVLRKSPVIIGLVFLFTTLSTTSAVATPVATDFDDLFGCANTSYLDGAAPQMAQLTGWGLGTVIALGLVSLIIGFMVMAWANQDETRNTKAVTRIKYALFAIGGALILFPIIIAVVSGFSTGCA